MYDAVAGRFASRDPIGFFAGVALYSYVGGHPLKSIDPSGWLEFPNVTSEESAPFGDPDEREYEVDPDWFVRRYQYCFGMAPDGYRRGCIGVVQDVAGKHNLADGSNCFSFRDAQGKDDAGRAYAAANQAAKDLGCKCGTAIVFAYRYWTNGKSPGCPKCGAVPNPIMPPNPARGATGIPFDFCVRMASGHWLGGTHAGGNIVVWPNLHRFSKKYKNYDTTVVCATCTGKGYQRGGFLGLNPHLGCATPSEIRTLGDPPSIPIPGQGL
jgi:hypothetical protein